MLFGAALGLFGLFSVAEVFWLAVVAFSVVLIGLRSEEPSAKQVLFVGVCLFCCSVGLLRASYVYHSFSTTPLASIAGEEVELVARVAQEPQQRENTMHIYAALNDEVLLLYADRYTPVSYGDTIEMRGSLETPESFTTDLGRTFHYPEYLKARGVTHVMYYPTVTVIDSDETLFLSRLYRAKDTFRDALGRLLPAPQVGLGEGLLLGVQGALSSSWEAVFREVGIIHIVVLSGYNIMLVIVFVQYVLAYLLPFRARLIVGFLSVICFALLVGLSPTVVRASVMASLLLFLRFSGNTYNVLRGLVIAGVLMVLINPYLLLYDPGFQLSFLATLGLILLAPQLERFTHWLPESLGLREFFLATVTTQFFVLPFLLYQIGEVSIVSVLVNVLVLPAVPLAMLLTFLTGVSAFVVPPLAPLVGLGAYAALTYILRVAELFAEVPFASVRVPAFSVWVMLLLYGLLAFAVYLCVRIPKIRRPYRHWVIEDESTLRTQKTTSPDESKVAFEQPVFFVKRD